MSTYDPLKLEPRWFPYWEEKGYFKPSFRGRPFCIMLPPPNVTGTLHMGHAFQDTIMDALTRYHRMLGENTLWQPGIDHAGIATQIVVERLLEQQGLSREELGREAFLKKVWEWKEQSGETIVRQMKRLGCSCDWSRLRFTMDEGLSRAVREVFVRLYEDGLIYRGKRLVNWDPVLKTALSDLEVVWEEEEGFLWFLRYPLAEGSGHIVVATTRPETMLGDVAVAVHPEDERYRALVGKRVRLPLTDREIPIIADREVDPEFGTGAVKITPAHDFHDYEIGKRHRLPLINIFTPEARLNEKVPEPYRGLDRFEARRQIVEDLDRMGLLERVEKHRHQVPRGDRSGAILEPYLTDQWFVDLTREGFERITRPAMEVVSTGRLRFVPENWSRVYLQWLEQIEDWCISRQIWWGHRIPAWYDEEGQVYVGRSEEEVRRKFGLKDRPLRQEEDVLDTWFSSALWPFSTLGWPERTRELETFYPTSVLVTGFDIIFFWVARMVMMGLYFMKEVPFREVYIHGLVRDAHGQKMSKSKGNILDPLDIIEGIDLESLVQKRTFGLMQPKMASRIAAQTRKEFPNGIPAYGADALRFTFASLATTGRNINFDLKRVEGSRNFLNKLWNACRYISLNASSIALEGDDGGGHRPDGETLNASALRSALEGSIELGPIDLWIRSHFDRTVQEVREALESYRLDFAAQRLYDFLWEEFCDWYLEFTKLVLREEPLARRRGTMRTLLEVLERYLRLAHPVIPFITEELWHQVAPLLGKEGDSIMVQPYPETDPSWREPEAEREIEWLRRAISETRRIRAQFAIPPSREIALLLQGGSQEERAWAEAHRNQIALLTRAREISWLEEGETPPVSAMALAGDLKIYMPLAGLVDREAELARLAREISRRERELERVARKLQDQNFLERAPEEVVAKEREKRARLERELEELRAQRATVEQLS